MTLQFSYVLFAHNKPHLGRYTAILAIEANMVQYQELIWTCTWGVLHVCTMSHSLVISIYTNTTFLLEPIINCQRKHKCSKYQLYNISSLQVCKGTVSRHNGTNDPCNTLGTHLLVSIFLYHSLGVKKELKIQDVAVGRHVPICLDP